jgi:hypothetical protein
LWSLLEMMPNVSAISNETILNAKFYYMINPQL